MHSADLIVDIGLLDGYSLLAFARSDAKEVVGIDLFDDYDYSHGQMEDIYDLAQLQKVDHKIKLLKGNAFEAYENFNTSSIDILHIDIANTGENLPELFDLWYSKVKTNGLILFEGGSIERDNVEWMTKYEKVPINDFKKKIDPKKFEFLTLHPFPSLTLCRKL